MPISKNTYKLTNKAEEDLLSIAYYTIDKFGANQARTYRDGLIKTLEFLVLNPHLGRVLFLENNTIKRHHYRLDYLQKMVQFC